MQLPTKTNVTDFVLWCRERLQRAVRLAKKALSISQVNMKERFDKKTVDQQFQPGDSVLMLQPTPGAALTARFSGPYVVDRKVSETDYVIRTPERRRKTHVCHVNMLKSYRSRSTAGRVLQPSEVPVVGVSSMVEIQSEETNLVAPCDGHQCGRLKNSEFLSTINDQLSYLSVPQRQDIIDLLRTYTSVLGDVPTCTSVLRHDIDVGDASPIRQHVYRCSPAKREAMRTEVEYLVENGFAKPSCSPWSSPCVMVPKSDDTPRFCSDFRKVNAVTKTD